MGRTHGPPFRQKSRKDVIDQPDYPDSVPDGTGIKMNDCYYPYSVPDGTSIELYHPKLIISF